MIPPVQQLQSCDFDDSYRDILLVVNVARKALSNSPFANSISNGGIKNGNPVSLCMNGKLMMAAKLQSDFQALAKTPTHSGPRLSRLGSLEERLLWARFGLVGSPKIASPADSILDLDNLWQRQQQQSTETQQSKPNEPMTDCALFKQSKPSAEELIFFWPRGAGSLSQPIDRGLLRMRLKQAIRAWAADLPSVAILTNPTYRFFGAGYTRTQEGAMYLTVILGQANNEKCNLCPFDVSPVPPLPPSNDVIVEEEVIVYDS